MPVLDVTSIYIEKYIPLIQDLNVLSLHGKQSEFGFMVLNLRFDINFFIEVLLFIRLF